MKGVYLIQSPTNKFYVGQSINIDRRFWQYLHLKINGQRKLLASLVKHGAENHTFKAMHELPLDVSKETMVIYEQFYLDQFNEAGIQLLNIKKTAGIHGGHSEETKKRIGDGHRGKKLSEEHKVLLKSYTLGKVGSRKGKTHTEETKAKIKAKRALQTNVVGRPIGNIPWNKGMLGVYGTSKKGVPVSQEQKDKISKTLTGKKLSFETIAKRTASVIARTERKKGWSDEAKEKQRQRVILFNQNKRKNAIQK